MIYLEQFYQYLKETFTNRSKMKALALHCLLVVVCIGLLTAGRTVAKMNLATFDHLQQYSFTTAKVTEIIYDDKNYGLNRKNETQRIVYRAILNDANIQAPKPIEVIQYFEDIPGVTFPVQSGDQVIVIKGPEGDSYWQHIDFLRIDGLFWLSGAFVLTLLLIGRWKGVNTLISLVLTCLSIFFVLIPAILSGKNIYLWSILVCFYIIAMTLLIVNGFNNKSYSSILGCSTGIVFTGILTWIMNKTLLITGMLNEESHYLTQLKIETPIDLKAIIFGAIIIGALGAIMDIAITIASALWEVQEANSSLSMKALMKSGMNIGQDAIGTMTNTLVLAYIGSSLPIVLLLTVYTTSGLELFNREMIVVEILQALVGSFGILLTVPFTSFVSSFLYTKNTSANKPL